VELVAVVDNSCDPSTVEGEIPVWSDR